ncbi:hypothetical protein BJP40_10815 [Streptomyces sp. CC53]|nr:hypothetical protein BJP40_10815 [Streptomyces sp. CC53]
MRPDALSHVAVALLTAFWSGLAFVWWFSLSPLFEQGPCGTRYGGAPCPTGTGGRITPWWSWLPF